MGMITTKAGKSCADEAEVTLINKHNYHYITTQLHKTSAGTARITRWHWTSIYWKGTKPVSSKAPFMT